MRSVERTVSRDCVGVVTLWALALGAGCGDPAGPPVATTIEISPRTAILKDARDTVRLAATVEDQHGRVMKGVPISWSSGDSVVAQVSIDGLVTGEEVGTLTVQASTGEVTANATIVVNPGPRAVLHKVYRVMGGNAWENNNNWRTEAPVGSWHGVHMDNLGIMALRLWENGLTGHIPSELGSLRSLRILDLSGNELSGSIPPELGSLHSLEGLFLSDNELSGSIPPELGGLRGLILSLNLSRNELSGSIPPELGSLRSLRILDLSGNELSGSIPPELRSLQSLRVLDLSQHKLAGPLAGELRSIPPLRELYVFGNPLVGSLPREMLGLSFLKVFHWNRTNLCAPADAAFQSWLNAIEDHIGNRDCTP